MSEAPNSNAMEVDPADGKSLLIKQAETLSEFLAMMDGPFLAHDLGRHLSCEEAEVFVSLLKAYGLASSAEQLLDGHCTEDEEGDDPEHLKRAADLAAT